MNNNQVIVVQASGYKTHLCSNEEQVQSIIRDIKTRKPDSECNTRIWEMPYLYFDNGKPFVKDHDFIIVDLPQVSLKFCMTDFTAMSCSINYGRCYPVENLVLLTSSLYCSVLTPEQAQVLSQYAKDHFDELKSREDAYYRKYADKLKELEDKLFPANSKNNSIN